VTPWNLKICRFRAQALGKRKIVEQQLDKVGPLSNDGRVGEASDGSYDLSHQSASEAGAAQDSYQVSLP